MNSQYKQDGTISAQMKQEHPPLGIVTAKTFIFRQFGGMGWSDRIFTICNALQCHPI